MSARIESMVDLKNLRFYVPPILLIFLLATAIVSQYYNQLWILEIKTGSIFSLIHAQSLGPITTSLLSGGAIIFIILAVGIIIGCCAGFLMRLLGGLIGIRGLAALWPVGHFRFRRWRWFFRREDRLPKAWRESISEGLQIVYRFDGSGLIRINRTINEIISVAVTSEFYPDWARDWAIRRWEQYIMNVNCFCGTFIAILSVLVLHIEPHYKYLLNVWWGFVLLLAFIFIGNAYHCFWDCVICDNFIFLNRTRFRPRNSLLR